MTVAVPATPWSKKEVLSYIKDYHRLKHYGTTPWSKKELHGPIMLRRDPFISPPKRGQVKAVKEIL